MSRPTIVLLHGVGLDHTMWEPVAALLRDRFEVRAPDLPGHGTCPPAPPGTTLSDLAQGVIADIPAGSHVLGFSLGALVAQHIAAHRPELVATLTSVSSVCRRTNDERRAVLGRLRAAESDFGTSAAVSIERWYGGTDVPQEWVRRTESTLLANSLSSFLACYRVFAAGDEDVAPLLGQISAPALAITGADDPGSTPEMTHRLAEVLPNCRAVVVPETRHMLPVQRPRELVDAMTTLIEEDAHA
ncbi:MULTISPECIES: alpha/beta fold hydrolase [Nocardioides]|uniref:Alpha/beta fold hydrolase n=1 Tax=Nocardioides vastitatis TaxID=2568655 RepID=A0ABW0ZKR1_9ACTN|nr:alpha/beta hydrolase [Nocardioides sp.]THI93509.1 alpha/beta fold hydrolase [Nocardioides sp.]